MSQEKSLTPMMKQWQECKVKAKDALLLFRLGDFYEAFYADAELISKKLNLTLTKRQNIPMCGVPAHTCEAYVDKLVAKGFKVAIAEQLEDPKDVKGIVKREIVRFVSPATVVSSTLLKDKTNNYFASMHQVGSFFGLAYIDLTTAEFRAMEVENTQELLNEISRIKPKEFLIEEKFLEKHGPLLSELSKQFHFALNVKEGWLFDHQLSLQKLTSHFKVKTLDGFGMKAMIAAINASGALFSYLQDELSFELSHIQAIHIDSLSSYMSLDRSTMSHLELIDSLHSQKENTLLHLLDQTLTAMGGRLLRKWLQHPLLDIEKINLRLDAVEKLILHPFAADSFLEKIKDLERLAMKIKNGYESPRDIFHLILSLQQIPEVKKEIQFASSPYIIQLFEDLHNFTTLCDHVLSAIVENPPLRISDGKVFKKGFSAELDEIRLISSDSKIWIAKYQAELREKTKIKTLKIGYTKVFGYYIDVSKGQAEKVPSSFQRKQTLVNSERYITEELKDYEVKIFSAEEKMRSIEATLYDELRKKVASYFEKILITAKAIAQIDVLFSLAKVALENEYVKPHVDTSRELSLVSARHPIIEKTIGKNSFIANDTFFSTQEQLFLITGPNMAGKSTYIRQVALIVIMAQMGSFVPAKKARIGLVDKLFSRIGASDDLSRGQSTFMMEMCETANILNNATDRSLVILDEIGRGTSTYDGISIAWAVCEYLLTENNQKAKTLFATHYWELTELEQKFTSVVNLQVAVKETDSGVMFLHKIVKGATDKSYGIHVAKLAGLPFKVICRAEKMLKELEKKHRRSKTQEKQSTFFDLPQAEKAHPLLDEIKRLDINRITPMEALQKLLDMQKEFL